MTMGMAMLAGLLGAPQAGLRHAVVVGSNKGSHGLEPLLFAEDDAGRFADILVELGGFQASSVTVLRGADRNAIEVALQDHAVQATGDPDDFFLFYYSGHADQSGLRLGNDALSFEDLRWSIRKMDSEVRLGILDACRSGEITRVKGLTVADPFADGTGEPDASGEAWLTAASADEAAQESDRIRGSFFTHYLLSALRGAADQGDGIVSLGEAYAYAYDRTVARTGATSGGTQHPTYDYRIQGRGDLPLTSVNEGSASIVLPPEMQGVLSILRLPDRTPIAEVAKPGGVPIEVALPPGSYTLQLREGEAMAEATIGLTAGAEQLIPNFEPTPIELASAKGTGAADEGLLVAWARQAEQAMGALGSLAQGSPNPFRVDHGRSSARSGAPSVEPLAWPGSPDSVLACADRGAGCLRDVFQAVAHGDGPIVGHAADGSLVFQGLSSRGVPSGYWTFFHPSGTKRCEGAYVSGVKAGTWTCWYDSGNLDHRTEFRGDWEDGTRTEYFPSGQRARRLEMSNGVASGHVIEWYETGKKKSDGRLEADRPAGTWTYFYETGSRKEQGHFDSSGRTGSWIAWHPNGQRASVGRFERGSEDGNWDFWWNDGSKQASGRFSNGRRTGHWKEWYDDDVLAAEGVYEDGVKVGRWREWYPSGKSKARGRYADGHPIGVWREWEDDEG